MADPGCASGRPTLIGTPPPDMFVRRHRSIPRYAGFSLVELVVILILIGILAVVAIPRLNIRTFEARGFFDEVRATVRFAQKDAIAKRRNVCLTFASNSLTVTYSPSELAPAACSANIVSPRGVTPFSVTAPTGVTLAATSNFRFDGLGRPSAGPITVTVTGDGVRSFTVQSETGYVQ
jgi:MSHA pilin protein MshC